MKIKHFKSKNMDMDIAIKNAYYIDNNMEVVCKKRIRQVRDALNKCRDLAIIEKIAKLLHL